MTRQSGTWMQASVALVVTAVRAMRRAVAAPPRETSWRDLVRRLTNNPPKR